MTSRRLATIEDLKQAGWTASVDDGFVGLAGPIWQLLGDTEVTCGFFAEEKHKNRSGRVHGGMLATLADRALGLTARRRDPSRKQVTIDLNIQFIDAAHLGDFVTATGKLLRETSTLAFLSGQIRADDRLIANVSGIWRILSTDHRQESESQG